MECLSGLSDVQPELIAPVAESLSASLSTFLEQEKGPVQEAAVEVAMELDDVISFLWESSARVDGGASTLERVVPGPIAQAS